MSYSILLIILLLTTIFIYKVTRNILSPSFIYSLSLTGCLLFSILGMFYWNNIYDLSFKTALILLISLYGFFAGEIISSKFLFKNKTKNDFSKIDDHKVSNISMVKVIIQVSFVILAIILMYLEVKRIAIIAGYVNGGFGEMIGKYRSLTSLYTTVLIEEGTNINFIVSQMRKVCEVICFINIYYLIKNLCNGFIKNKNNIFHIIIILLNIVLAILCAGRMQLFIYIVFAFAVFINLKLFNSSLNDFLNKYVKKLMVCVILVLTLFCVMLPLSGRKFETTPVSYLSYYFGISIPSLERYNRMDIEKPKIFGEEVFRGYQNILYKIDLSDYIQPISKEWVNFKTKEGKLYQSNIFTSGKRYYHDFGYIGIFLCQIIFGFVFSTLYLFSTHHIIMFIFYYSYFYMIIDQVRDELFFSEFLYVNTAIRLFLMIILYLFLNKKICLKRK